MFLLQFHQSFDDLILFFLVLLNHAVHSLNILFVSKYKKFDRYIQLDVLVYSGLFKEARKLLKNGDLDYLKEIDPTEYIYQIFYIWKQKEYLASELHDLTEQEKRELN